MVDECVGNAEGIEVVVLKSSYSDALMKAGESSGISDRRERDRDNCS